jgi:hypothetical protein
MMQNDCYCDTCQNVRDVQGSISDKQKIAELEAQIKILKDMIIEMKKPAPGHYPPYTVDPFWSRPIGKYTTWDASSCPCNPQNGGSGVCGCVMGSQNIS